MEHKKTPWLLDKRGENLCSDGKPVCVWGLNLTHSNASEQTKANAAFIVKAVNERKGLFDLLALIRDDLRMRSDFDSEDGGAIINLSGFIWDKLNEAIDRNEEDGK